ncbi:hypothetical protein Tco_0532136 [Tanacetum coccineum]
MEIKKQWVTRGIDVGMEYDSSDVEFAEWLASKFHNYKTMDRYTKNALWIYWTRGDDEVEHTDEEFSDPNDENLIDKDEVAEIFMIETNIFDFETPTLTKNIRMTEYINGMKMCRGYKKNLGRIIDWKDDGYCNGGNLPGAFRVGNTLCYKDLEWYEALEDGKLKVEALKNKATMEGLIDKDEESYDEAWRRWDDYENTTHNIKEEMESNDDHDIGNLDYDLVRDNTSYHTNDEEEQDEEDRCELLGNPCRELSVCEIERFEMIKYSFGPAENYVAIKECGYEDLTRTEDDACHAYQEIFRIMDEGWFVTRVE